MVPVITSPLSVTNLLREERHRTDNRIINATLSAHAVENNFQTLGYCGPLGSSPRVLFRVQMRCYRK